MEQNREQIKNIATTILYDCYIALTIIFVIGIVFELVKKGSVAYYVSFNVIIVAALLLASALVILIRKK